MNRKVYRRVVAITRGPCKRRTRAGSTYSDMGYTESLDCGHTFVPFDDDILRIQDKAKRVGASRRCIECEAASEVTTAHVTESSTTCTTFVMDDGRLVHGFDIGPCVCGEAVFADPEQGVVVHVEPSCNDYMSRSPLEFVTWLRRAKGIPDSLLEEN